MPTEGAELSAREAVQEIDRLTGIRGALERRTTGITWMIWGLVTPGIFVTYSMIGLVVAYVAPEAGRLFPFLWIPWIILGYLATRTLWRSAGLVNPSVVGRRRGLLTLGVFLVVSNLAFALVAFTGAPLVEPAIMLGLIGLVLLLLGTSGFACQDRLERNLRILGGVLLLAIVFVLALTIRDRITAYALYSLIGPGAAALLGFGGGLYLSTRG